MLIILVGTPYSGKSTLSNHLSLLQLFTQVTLSPTPTPTATTTPTTTLSFSTPSSFLHYATKNYTQNYITDSISDLHTIHQFLKRPFVALVSIQAPIGVRFKRAIKAAQETGRPLPSLEDFVAADDLINHGVSPLIQLPTTGLARSPLADLIPHIHLTLSNPYSTLSEFYSSLSFASLSLPLPSLDTLSLSASSTTATTPTPTPTSLLLLHLSSLLRPPWDIYFMRLSLLASLRSNCMKRRVGAVLVREKRVVSTGYNGTPRGVDNCNEGGCERCNLAGGGEEEEGGMGKGLDECVCLHAEENALLEAGRERVSGGGTKGAVLYCNTCPCLRCTVKIVQCGVTEVVYSLSYSMDEASRRVLEKAGVGLRQMSLPDL